MDMSAKTVVELIKFFDYHHIEVIVDGGWAVDALLGRQTRPHADLDIAMPHRFVPELRAILGERGYVEVPRNDTRECNFVLGDAQGHLLDVHTYEFDEHGHLVFGLAYPLDSLDGHGTILGYPVRCITPGWLVKFHTSYRLDENDFHDVSLLCQRFGIEMPQEYNIFTNPG